MEDSQPEHNIEEKVLEEQKPVEKPEERKQEKPKEKGPSIFLKLKNKIGQWRRTIAVARKPGKEEFLASIKITGVGILLLGFIGFVIYLIYHLVW
ncbi:MAG: protein translocase SEC61 complex subunit gamma [Nanoarchaeota archaeon]|nr:protein translocase SEC61 complex subunit gamma [Nanoarchaeota archaeon]MBU4123965.1 protein translocase SEC61 complex subunit gamma [Nanoarchaeota archaeon]